MGYLAYGAAAGVGQEFLKQSDEKRKHDYTAIRDKRLKEMQGELIDQRQGLLAQREIDSDERKSAEAALGRTHQDETAAQKVKDDAAAATTLFDRTGPGIENVGAGTAGMVWDSAKKRYVLARDQPNKPLAGSAKDDLELKKTLYRMKADGSKGIATNWKELQQQYMDDPNIFIDDTVDDGFGGTKNIKKRVEGAPSMTDYINRQLHVDSRVLTNDMATIRRDPDQMWKWVQTTPEFKQRGGRERAIESIQKLHKGWPWGSEVNNPGTEGPNTGSPDLAGRKKQNPQNNEGPNAGAPVTSGMLEQSQASAGPGRLVESSWEIQRTLQFLQTELKSIGRGPGGKRDPNREAELNQQIQQYKILLQRAQDEETKTQSRGRTPQSATPSATQIATGQ